MVSPKHMYLRVLVLDDKEKASLIRQQLLAGGSFFMTLQRQTQWMEERKGRVAISGI